MFSLVSFCVYVERRFGMQASHLKSDRIPHCQFTSLYQMASETQVLLTSIHSCLCHSIRWPKASCRLRNSGFFENHIPVTKHEHSFIVMVPGQIPSGKSLCSPEQSSQKNVGDYKVNKLESNLKFLNSNILHQILYYQ